MKQFLVLAFLFLVSFGYLFAQEPNDCVNSIIVCGNSNIDLDVEGVGIQELNGFNNCSSEEHNTIWFKVTAASSGTMGFVLTPNSTDINEDYDFFIYGPNVSCSNLGMAIRCSTTNPAMANQGNNLTGMKDTVDDGISEGPGPDGDSFVEWLTVQTDETYYIVIDRPIGTSPFSLQWTGTSTFYDAPNSQLPSGQDLDYEECESNGSGFALFDLTQDESLVVGNQSVSVAYYASISDAQIGINQIVSPIAYATSTTTLFIKLTDLTTACFSIFDINIVVTPFVSLPTLDDLESCETDGNNKEIFDLSQDSSLVSQLASNYVVSYHENENRALSGQLPLPLLYENASNPQTIWMRFEDLDTGCIGISTFNISVYNTPTANSISDIIVCDNDATGFFNFDLVALKPGILNGQNSSFVDISFYHSLDDANNDVNFLTPNYTNEQAYILEEIFVRVENNIHPECYQTTSFTIDVLEKPIANQLEDITVCDDDGFLEMDLELLKQDVWSGQDELLFNISFHHTQDEADNNLNSLSLLYTNMDLLEEIFIRIENKNLTTCYDTSSFLLNVFVEPVITPLDKWNICDDENNDGFYSFDFSTLEDVILNGQDETVMAISFYKTQVDADYKITPLDLIYINELPFTEEEIYIRLENIDFPTCYSTASFLIEVVENPIFTIIEDTKYLCTNLSAQEVQFKIENTTTSYSYSWQDDDGNELSNSNTVVIDEIGDYTITATTEEGVFCSRTKMVHVLPAEPATILDFVIHEFWEEENFSLEVIVQGSGIYQYAIDDVNGIYQNSNILLNVQAGFHVVYVKEMNACGIVSKEVAAIGFKKFFSPNNDGVNDVWKVQGIAFKAEEKITIFNRYGKVMSVFYPALDQGWDGYYNRKPANEDSYWFVAEMTDGNGKSILRKGFFSLVITGK